MKKIFMTIVFGLMLSISASAGQIYGSLTYKGRPLAKVQFNLKCNGEQYGTNGWTDDYGAYRISVPNGKCTFTLYYGNPHPTAEVYSSNDPLRYDFELVVENGVYKLQRR